ncbi:MAG: DNA-processing protein DprA [bacterium]|nr:DNA-processing protein DprA [bacterium]
MDERFYYLAFSVFPGVGPTRFGSLLKNFGSAKNAWFAKQTDLKEILGEKLTAKFEGFKSKFSIEDYIKQLQRKNVSFVCLTEEGYPEFLKQIKNPPFVLYVLGDLSFLSPSRSPFTHLEGGNVIAVVGTRKITSYGREVTRLLTQDLVNAGFTIVSGLAFGVDSVAHQTAIDSGGKTIAVLGSGVDLCFPSSNLSLYNNIISGNGCVVSQYPLGEPPSKGSFPSRNRTIAGLSTAVLVTEGAEDSGALITADYAFKFNRKVFAVPGPITSSLSKGPYKLIEKGAKLVTRAEDILNELSITGSIKSIRSIKGGSVRGGTKDEQKILELLENEAVHFDQIVREMRSNSSTISSLLSIMEIKGLVKSSSGGFFSVSS